MITDNTKYYVSAHLYLYFEEHRTEDEFIVVTTSPWYTEDNLRNPPRGWMLKQEGPFDTLDEARTYIEETYGPCHTIEPEKVGYASGSASIVETYGMGPLPWLSYKETYSWMKKRNAFQDLGYDTTDEEFAELEQRLQDDLEKEGYVSEHIGDILFDRQESWREFVNEH